MALRERLGRAKRESLPAEVHVADARLVAAVSTRCAWHRVEPRGLPREPSAADLRFIAGRLRPPSRAELEALRKGKPLAVPALTAAELEAVGKLWTADRARGIAIGNATGGAMGFTTFTHGPHAKDPLERLDDLYERFARSFWK